jgi:hypothetical protein
MRAADFDGVEILLIDGNNLLHRVSGSVEPGAQRLLLARLRSAVPATLATVLMLDGHADSGTSRTERVGRGLEIRHSGSISADDAILRLIDKYQPSERAGITVVSDDRRFTDRARHLGAHTQRLAWLENVIGMPGEKGAAIGAGKPPAGRPPGGKFESTPPSGEGETTDDREPWRPGRGATRKRGNPKRRGR